MPFWRWPRHLWLWRCIIMVAAASSMRHISIVCHLTTNTCESLILLYFTHKSNNYIKLWNKTNTILSIYKCCPTMQLQEGQHLLTGQFQFTISIANFRLLANQWAERRLVTQLRHGCLAMRWSVCNAGASNAGRSLCIEISRERSYPCQYIDTTRKTIDCATICRWQFLYNATLQQTFRPLLSKYFQRRQI